MPDFDFDTVEGDAFDLIPEDIYLCRIVKIQERRTSQGPLWDLALEVQEGEHKGARIADALMWFGGGLKRTKACLSAMGFEVSGKKNWHPSNLIGMPVDCQVVHREREYDGKKIIQSKPSYKGYCLREDLPWKPQSVPAAAMDALDNHDNPF